MGVQAPTMTRLGASSSQDPRPRTGVPGFLLDRGRYRGFDVPEAQLATLPYDVNNRGQIVGAYENTNATPNRQGTGVQPLPGMPER